MNTLTWKEARKHGIEGTDLNFEFKMASLDNVVFIDCRIMDVAFLISLTHKNFSSAGEQSKMALCVPKVMILGHSFVRRISGFLENHFDDCAKINFDLDDAKARLFGLKDG